jgi:hypothetical protein
VQLADVVALARSADLIIGWRIMRRDPIVQRVNAAAWNWVVRRWLHLPVRDVDCAFKLIRRDLFERVELTSDGAMINTELVVKCRSAGARLAEAGVRHRPRGRGHWETANGFLRGFGDLARLRGTLGQTS